MRVFSASESLILIQCMIEGNEGKGLYKHLVDFPFDVERKKGVSV